MCVCVCVCVCVWFIQYGRRQTSWNWTQIINLTPETRLLASEYPYFMCHTYKIPLLIPEILLLIFFTIWPPAAILKFENIFFYHGIFSFTLGHYKIVIQYCFSVYNNELEWHKHKPSFLVDPIWPPAAILDFEILRGNRGFLIRDTLRNVYGNFGACIIMWTIPLKMGCYLLH